MRRLTFTKAEEYLDSLTNKEMRSLIKAYKLSKKEIDNLISKIQEEYADNWFSMPKYKRLKAVNDQITKTINVLTKKTNPMIIVGTSDNYVKSYDITTATFETKVSTGLSFNQLDKTAIANAIKNPLTKVSSIQRNTQNLKDLKNELTNNLITGKSYKQTSKKVAERFNVAVHKADRIVRTENHRVSLEARYDGMKQANEQGIIMQKEWIAAGDKRTRSAHRELDGVTIGIKSYFQSSAGGRGLYPGAMGGSDDINCRCSIASIIY